jgi:hypothetical protein
MTSGSPERHGVERQTRPPPNKALQLMSAQPGVPRLRRPPLAPLAGRLLPPGGTFRWYPGARSAALAAERQDR